MPLFSRLAAAALLLAAAACSSPCIDVQVALCACKFKTQDEKNTCKSNAQAQEKLAPETTEQLTACSAIVTTCQAFIDKNGCDALQTPQGREACGLTKQ